MPACFGYKSRIRDHWTVNPDIEWFAAQQALELQQKLDQM